MTNNYGIIKCQHCGKCFFSKEIDNENCPFCKKSLNYLSDIFTDVFGNQNNPFQDFTNNNNDV